MKAIDRLPERGLEKALRESKQDSAELKGAFQRFGSTSVLTTRIWSQADYDAQVSLNSGGTSFAIRQVDVEFIPDDKVFGGALCYRVYCKTMDGSNNDYSPPYRVESERQARSDGRQIFSFFVPVYGTWSDVMRMKFYLFTTGSGTFTADVIS